MDFSKRTPKEVVERHFEVSDQVTESVVDNVLNEELLESMMEDFAEDCVFITLEGIYRGHKEIKEWFENFMPKTVNGEWKMYGPVYENNIAFFKWDMENKTHTVKGAVETCIIKDGLFQIVAMDIPIVPKGK